MVGTGRDRVVRVGTLAPCLKERRRQVGSLKNFLRQVLAVGVTDGSERVCGPNSLGNPFCELGLAAGFQVILDWFSSGAAVGGSVA